MRRVGRPNKDDQRKHILMEWIKEKKHLCEELEVKLDTEKQTIEIMMNVINQK